MRISSFATAHRQREGERRAQSLLTLHPDPPAVQLDELPTQSQPQASAFHLLGRRPHLAELLKDLLLVLGSDTDPSVADRDLHESILRHCADFNPPALVRELDGIREKVQDDLTDLALVRLNLAKPVIDVRMKRD